MIESDPIDRTIGAARRVRNSRAYTQALKERIQESLYNDLAEVCANQEIMHPGGFLANLMAGIDPRNGVSRIAQIIESIRMRGPGEMPSEDEWSELADLISLSPLIRGESVPLEVSARAAKELLPYLYEARKAAKGEAEPAPPAVCSPLTKAEIEAFKAVWEATY